MANDLGIGFERVNASYEKELAIDQATWVNQKVDEAVRKLYSVCPGLKARIASGDADRELVIDKVVAAVLRVIRNPEGLVSEGEGEYNYRVSPLVASGNIWYPKEDLQELGCGELPKARTIHVKTTPRWGYP